MDVCNLLPGGSKPIEQLMNASSVSLMRIISEQTSPLADDVKCNQFFQQPSSCSGTNAKMLLSFRIVDAQSNADNLLLETFLSVSDMSGPAQLLGSRSRAVAQRWPPVAAAAGCCASPSARGHRRYSGHVCNYKG
tara:strand:+ start:317 stop:721 length:405 start_codon:yes stop_codon:yes gene_type:complete